MMMSLSAILLSASPAVAQDAEEEMPLWEIALAAGSGGLGLLILCYIGFAWRRSRKATTTADASSATPTTAPPVSAPGAKKAPAANSVSVAIPPVKARGGDVNNIDILRQAKLNAIIAAQREREALEAAAQKTIVGAVSGVVGRAVDSVSKVLPKTIPMMRSDPKPPSTNSAQNIGTRV